MHDRGLNTDPGLGAAPRRGDVGAPSQIQFDRDGRVLIVDERGGAGTIDTFVVDRHGAAGPAETIPASAGGPFGFDVDRRGHILFSEHRPGRRPDERRHLLRRRPRRHPDAERRSGLVRPGGACWLAAARRFAYTTNAGSGSIGRFAVRRDGTLSLLGTTVIGAGSQPLDVGATRDQDFIYVLANGLHQIIGYRVGRDGGLTQVASVPVPDGAIGLDAA